jgi:hypothetical protein
MNVFPASHLDVYAANEPGLAGEQSAFADLICSQRCLFCSWRHMASGSVAKRPKFLSKNIKRAEKYFEVMEKSGAEFLTDILKKGSKLFKLVGNTD